MTRKEMKLTEREIELIGHSLGINVFHCKMSKKKPDKKLPKEFYRNYFCASVNHSDYKDLCQLETNGYMESYHRLSNLYFGVTEKGIDQFRVDFIELVTVNLTPDAG